VTDFKLSAHEVMRGIKLRDGRLSMRPSGLVILDTILDALLGIAIVAGAVIGGGAWWLVAPYGAFLAVDGTVRLRVSVTADQRIVTVRNRWRTHDFPLERIDSVEPQQVEWLFRSPAYAFTGWCGRRQWEVGAIRAGGNQFLCDALISLPREPDSDPTPTEMKVAALERWIATVRRGAQR
jgi:hypothetical protein